MMERYALVDQDDRIVEIAFPIKNLRRRREDGLKLIKTVEPILIGDKWVDGEHVPVTDANSQRGRHDADKRAADQFRTSIKNKLTGGQALTGEEVDYLLDKKVS